MLRLLEIADFKMKINIKNGFTLIELLVVISIIMVLSSLVLVTYQGVKTTARDGRRKADLEQIRSAIEIYRSDCNQYPPSLTWGSPLTGTGIGSCSSSPYMAAVPQDPFSSTYSYRYSRLTTNTYILCAYLEAGAVTTACTASCGGNCGTIACNYKACNP